jgi:hypothetical protein
MAQKGLVATAATTPVSENGAGPDPDGDDTMTTEGPQEPEASAGEPTRTTGQVVEDDSDALAEVTGYGGADLRKCRLFVNMSREAALIKEYFYNSQPDQAGHFTTPPAAVVLSSTAPSSPATHQQVGRKASGRKRKLLSSTHSLLEFTPEKTEAPGGPHVKQLRFEDVYGAGGSARNRKAAAARKKRSGSQRNSSVDSASSSLVEEEESSAAAYSDAPRSRRLRTSARKVCSGCGSETPFYSK